jgi:hypothetical protein
MGRPHAAANAKIAIVSVCFVTTEYPQKRRRRQRGGV